MGGSAAAPHRYSASGPSGSEISRPRFRASRPKRSETSSSTSATLAPLSVRLASPNSAS